MLLKPHESMKEEFLRYNSVWEDHGEKVVPYAARLRGRTFEEWLIESRLIEHHAPEGRVTASLWLLVKGDRVLGAITLRHGLNDYLMGVGGHIGYGVRPGERKKGYADFMLKKVLELAREMNLDQVLITCNKGNIPSERTIIKNGGILENEIEDGEEIVARYWIHL